MITATHEANTASCRHPWTFATRVTDAFPSRYLCCPKMYDSGARAFSIQVQSNTRAFCYHTFLNIYKHFLCILLSKLTSTKNMPSRHISSACSLAYYFLQHYLSTYLKIPVQNYLQIYVSKFLILNITHYLWRDN